MEHNKLNTRIIAFYLPQFHPIPENDNWWGKGFTEWTNVAKAKPLFKNHYQPRIPADLGFYDLRLSEVRDEQAEMAKYAGIEGFCYWHYWFGNGKRLLERPFNEVLKSGKPNFPFCLGWANETWSGIWHGDTSRILIEQLYPGTEDYKDHFFTMLPAFKDKRYITVNGKPLMYIYRPLSIPNNNQLIDTWQDLAIKNGLNGIHFVGQSADEIQAKKILGFGYDGVNTRWQKKQMLKGNSTKFIWNKLSEKYLNSNYKLNKWDFKKLVHDLSNIMDSNPNYYPMILSGWDNSPRSGKKGIIYINYNPESFEIHLKDVFERVKMKPHENNLVFLRSWNEWAEGNYVEPDIRYGWSYLDLIKKTFKV